MFAQRRRGAVMSFAWSNILKLPGSSVIFDLAIGMFPPLLRLFDLDTSNGSMPAAGRESWLMVLQMSGSQ